MNSTELTVVIQVPQEEGRRIQIFGTVVLGIYHTDTIEEMLLQYRTSAEVRLEKR